MLGIFDSGVGGLTVLQAIRKRRPDLSMIYLGDNARAPYGNRSRQIVTEYTKEGCAYLFERGCRLIVLACNTASAETLRALQQSWLPELRKKYDHPMNILGVIRPLAEEAVLHTKNNCIGVVGTRSTVESGTYVEELTALKDDIRVVQKACPLLVPLVEEGWHTKPEARKILKTYLHELKTHNPDVLILGCTHYEALHSLFASIMGSRCHVLNSPEVVARKLEEYLERHPEYAISRNGETSYLTTGDPERFAQFAAQCTGQKLQTAEHVHFEPLAAF